VVVKPFETRLITLLLVFLCACCVQAVCPEGDLSLDCEIDFDDVRVFAEQWLTDVECGDGECADMDGVDGVNIFDFALMVRNWRDVGNPIMINEFMASNSRFVQDPQEEYDDWLELYNAGDVTVDVGRMYLTDDPDKPMMWQIPPGTTIDPHGYLLIWADNDTGASPGLHANFELRAGGDRITLFAPDSNGVVMIDSISYDRQTSDISYGRYPDGSGNWRFLGLPSPDAQNEGAYLGEVSEVEFSHERGFYNSPISVTLATETEDAGICFTLDGREPLRMGHGSPVGYRYSKQIPISSTTLLRAYAFKVGWKSSRIKTNTYMFGASSAIKSLPIVSLVGDAGKTFYEPSGVMAIVGGSYDGGVWRSSGEGSYNNIMQHGMVVERPVSFEFFSEDKTWDFQEDCGIRVHGSDWMRPRYKRCDGVWSGNCKISFRLYFRSLYGKTWLNYKMFPYGQDRHDSIVLRGGHNDRTNPFIKDELLRRLHMDMGNAASTGTHANLFINGEYKGFFNPCEHIKDSYCQEYYNSNEVWDVMTMSGVRDGDSVSWNKMINYANDHDLSEGRDYEVVAGMLDIPAFADYLILQLWCGNWDWPQNNWSAASERSDEGLWRFFIWDAEGGMFSNRLSTVRFSYLNTQNNANGWLYRALKPSPQFRQVFADRIFKHFYNGGALTEARITERFGQLRDEMLGEIPNMNMYVLDTWVPDRLSIFLNACIAEGIYTFKGPTFKINGISRHGGYVLAGDGLSMSNPNGSGTMYYTLNGSDPRYIETSDSGTVTLVAEDAGKRVLVPTEDIGAGWRSVGFDDSEWTDGTPMIPDKTGGVGYDENPDYKSYISYDVEDLMNGDLNGSANTSAYVRIPFTADACDLGQFDALTLRIRYDDGFVAFINGARVESEGFSETADPVWNSKAASGHEAGSLQAFDITVHLNKLQIGDNVLAIQGLNTSTTSSDFLVSAVLSAHKTGTASDGISPTAIKYAGTHTLTKTTHVKARVLSGTTWSALSEATYSFELIGRNLRITEIMYHPQDMRSLSRSRTSGARL